MRRYQKILALTLVGTGAFMLPDTLPVQAATVQADSVQADAAVHSLQKVTAVTRVYGSGEQVAVAILEYPKALLPSAVKPTDFAVSGQEITAVMVNDKAELTDKAQAGRYVILQFVKQNNVYDGDLSKKPGRQAKPADDKNGQGTDAPRQSNRKLPDLSLQVQQVRPLTAIDGTTFAPLTVSATGCFSNAKTASHTAYLPKPYKMPALPPSGAVLSQHQPWQLWGICMKTGWV